MKSALGRRRRTRPPVRRAGRRGTRRGGSGVPNHVRPLRRDLRRPGGQVRRSRGDLPALRTDPFRPLRSAARQAPRTATGRRPTHTRRDTDMAEDRAQNQEPSGAERMFGDLAPALVHFTDDVLFGEAWTRPQLSPKERSLVTVAALTAGGNTEQLVFHLGLAKQNGATEEELIEAITHLAFYAGWPKAFSAMAVAKQVFRGN